MALRNWVPRRAREQTATSDGASAPARRPTVDGAPAGAEHSNGGPHGAPPAERPPPRTLGRWLRERREERGLALERVEEDTRIGRSYLEAIEGDRFELLPAPVYARGFVRLYARYLGLDPEEAVARVPKDLPRPRGLEPIPGLRRHEGAPALPAIERRWLLLAVAVAVVAAAALLLGVPGLGGGEEEAPPAGGGAAAGADAAAPAVAETAPVVAPTVPPFETGRTPDFRGVERATAEEVLQELGLTFLVIEVESGEAPAGRVFAQSPEPGAAIEAGDDVTLIVSRGAPAQDTAGE